MSPKLVLVSNHIGNEKDLPPRTKELLQSADLIIGEEARTTSTLLKKLGIEKDFILFNEHSDKQETEDLLTRLLNTALACMISDSGSPGIEDPAKKLVPLAWEYGIQVSVGPGPTAAMAALTASGFQSSPFLFLGFLPKEQKVREQELKRYLSLGMTLVLYETPYRTKHVLESLSKIVPGDRRIFLHLDISTEYETSYRGTAKEVLSRAKLHNKSLPVFVIEEKKTGRQR